MSRNIVALARMSPLQPISPVVQKHLADEQETHLEKTNKENYHLR